MFNASDFTDFNGNPASPQRASEIANKGIADYLSSAMNGPSTPMLGNCQDNECQSCFHTAKGILGLYIGKSLCDLASHERHDLCWAQLKIISRLGSRGFIEFVKSERLKKGIS